MITPFDDDLALDVDGAVELAKWMQAQGNEGLVVCGTTGESPTLSDDEKLQLWEAVAGAVTIPVIAGSTGNDTAHDVHLTVEASNATSPGSSPCARTTADRRRPASRPTCGRSPPRRTCRS